MIEFNTLEIIEKTGSTNEKKEIFKDFCKNDNNIKFIQLAFNNVEYNVAKKTMDDALNELAMTDNSWFSQGEPEDMDVITQIQGLTKYSGTDLKNKIMGIFTDMNDLQKKWFRRAILHNLEMGFDVKLINGVLQELGIEEVYYFEQPQLCATIKVIDNVIQYPEKIPKEVFVEEKFDGVRALVKKQDGKVEVISRNGKIYRNFKGIESAALSLPYDFTLDCEIVVDEDGRAMDNYQKLTTILQRINMGDVEIPLKCLVFDILELDGTDITSKTQFERRGILDSLEIGKPFERTKILWIRKHSQWSQIQDMYNEIITRGGEGIIIKDIHKSYEFDSRDRWWKVKQIIDDTFDVVGFGLGEGKDNKDKVAFLVVKVGENTNKVGSGITDAMSEWMTTNSGKLIGMKVDVQYTERTKDNKLRFPRFIKFRDDK